MKRCLECGKECPERSSFCPQCGSQRIESATRTDGVRPEAPSKGPVPPGPLATPIAVSGIDVAQGIAAGNWKGSRRYVLLGLCIAVVAASVFSAIWFTLGPGGRPKGVTLNVTFQVPDGYIPPDGHITSFDIMAHPSATASVAKDSGAFSKKASLVDKQGKPIPRNVILRVDDIKNRVIVKLWKGDFLGTLRLHLSPGEDYPSVLDTTKLTTVRPLTLYITFQKVPDGSQIPAPTITQPRNSKEP